MSFDQSSSDDDSQPEQQIVVSDPEDFAKTRMLRSIFDAKDAYIGARRDANRLKEDGEIGYQQRNRRVYRYMQEFAMATEPLLKNYDDGRQLWTEKTYQLQSWAEREDLVDMDTATEWAQRDAPEIAERIESEYDENAWEPVLERESAWIKADAIFTASDLGVEFDGIEEIVRTSRRLYFKSDRSRIRKSLPPQELSDQVFRDLQTFLSDIGLGVDMQTEQQTKIDDDLLEEVSQWRQKNA